jgi:DNA-directed RNA polymerase subunit RPC12/RpoP
MNLTCENCKRSLAVPPERAEGDWIIRCLFCGVKNIVEARPEIVGWRL